MKRLNLVGLIVLMLASFSLVSQNLVQNPGMENWDDDSTPASWTKAENISKESVNIHGGTFSAAHMSASSTQDLSQDVQGIVGGQQYRIQYYYLDNSTSARTRIWSYWMDSDDNYLDDNVDELRPGTYSDDNADWQHYDYTLVAPSNATQFRFEVRVYKQDGMTDGYVYYDDFSVEANVTNDPEPTNYPTDFAATVDGLTLTLSWTDAIGEQLPSGYLIKGQELIVASPDFDYPVDGVPETDDIDFEDGLVTVNVAYGAESYTFENMNPGTLYEFAIFPYSNSGDNIDYKTDGDVPFEMAVIPAIIVLNNEGFDDGLGTWTPFNVIGDQDWYQSEYSGKTFAKMSGYDSGAHDNEDWLISPELNMTQYDSVFFTFESAYNYDGPAIQLFVSSDYDGSSNPNDFTWTEITDMAVWSEGGFAFAQSGELNLMDYLMDNVYLAFKYTSNTSAASTWELDTFLIYAYMGVGVDETDEIKVDVYPNPASDIININSKRGGQIVIYSANGQKVMVSELKEGNNVVNINDINTGIYVLEINFPNAKSVTKKLIVK
ncbi:MAG: hypothetical protein C0598_12095 [Marinilabiliales bacterium]|nr:MAG: hypothetical protein C0598_12095 [Marinilabiliales bacterium]